MAEAVREMSEIPAEQHLSFPLARLNAKLTAQANRLLRKHSDLSLSEWRVVVFLSSRGEGSLADFIRFSGLDKSQMSKITQDLIRRGLVHTRQSEVDLRVQILSITPKGELAYQQALPHMRSRREHLIAALSLEEQAQYFSILSKIEAASEAYEAEL
ncbi:MarR family winged helix-turn-helix transcriptional regulator [Hoeflea poritis]|uniref:MarR family winged helix-turn-helix transcriptional regulator n=1 Tax=Hoeflea poritis TaxID=2993659 RepID=A0ABT4VUX3_9HYPH|nr:MarR family winged helix-turn-helix transcriptional regulator [Hoeflea poritis]MDA4848509.1 MarR family winged helix-turn-helix transcriptional regulator [Hoeflea poritis]